jgi:hypothetical protein
MEAKMGKQFFIGEHPEGAPEGADPEWVAASSEGPWAAIQRFANDYQAVGGYVDADGFIRAVPRDVAVFDKVSGRFYVSDAVFDRIVEERAASPVQPTE